MSRKGLYELPIAVVDASIVALAERLDVPRMTPNFRHYCFHPFGLAANSASHLVISSASWLATSGCLAARS